jgi:hypothetical protein
VTPNQIRVPFLLKWRWRELNQRAKSIVDSYGR